MNPKILRFDVELTAEELKQLDDILNKCYRSRKNFAEALVKLAINNEFDLSKLGIINR